MNFDIAIFIAFLIVNLIIGLFSSKGIKNIKDYALGGRSFATATIVATITATWIGGSNLSITIAETHKQGILFLICSLAEAVSFWLIACFYAPRMGEFLGKLSIADAMHGIYQSGYVRAIIAIFSTIPAIGRVAMQFSVLHTILSLWLGMPGLYAVALSSLIIITYSSLGGIKAVTFTDLIQFFTFGVVIPMVCFLVWKSFADNELIVNAVMTDPLFQYNAISDVERQGITDTVYLCLFLMIPLLDPAIFQRISMSKNTAQVSKSFLIAIFFILVCDALVHTVIGVLFRADPTIIDINADNVIPYIMDHYLHYGFKGIFIVGIMSMIMSTADSYINSSAILISYDFPKALGIEIKERKQLKLARFCSLVIGIVALLVSLFAENLLELLLSVYSFYMPIVTVPFTLAIFGFRTSSRALLVSMAAGFCTVCYFEFFVNEYNIISGIPGTLVSLIFLIGSHYILGEKGGWVGINDQGQFYALILAKRKRRNDFICSIRNFNLVRFCHNNTPKEERVFVYFGLFCIVTIFSNAYSLPKHLQSHYEFILTPIYYSVLTLSSIFITYPIWLKKFKNAVFISLLWNISVFYNLAFCSCLISVIGQFNQINVMVFMASLVVIANLMRWQVAIIIIIGGVIISMKSYTMFIDANIPDYMNNMQFKITYSLLLLSIILIAFFKPKQEQQEATEAEVGTLKTEVTHLYYEVTNLGSEVTDLNKKVVHYNERISDQEKEIERLGATAQRILNNVNHELRLPVGNVMNFAEMLNEGLGKFNEDHLKMLTDEVYKNSNRLSSMIMNMLDLAALNAKKLELDKKTINLGELVADRVKNCRRIYLENKKIDFVLEIQPELLISVDANYMRQVVDNLVINSIKFSSEGIIDIKLIKQKNYIEFTISDNGIGIPQKDLYDIFTPFKMGSNTESKAEGRGVGLALCKAAIEAHGGNIKADSKGGKGAIFRFVLSADDK